MADVAQLSAVVAAVLVFVVPVYGTSYVFDLVRQVLR